MGDSKGVFYARIIDMPNGARMATIADGELLGVEAVDEESGVRIVVSREFYGDMKLDVEEAERLLEEADVLVLAGDRIIGLALEKGLVHPESILEVEGVRHVQIYKFSF